MKNLSLSQQEALSRYVDGLMKPAEQKEFENALESDNILKMHLENLRMIHQTLLGVRVEQPSKNFTNVVMHGLSEYPLKSSGPSVRNGIFLLIGVLVAVGIGSVLLTAGIFDSTTTLGVPHPALIERVMKRSIPDIPFNGKLVVNIIILLNLGLAWLVLDKTILKPLFQRRMEVGERSY